MRLSLNFATVRTIKARASCQILTPFFNKTETCDADRETSLPLQRGLARMA